MISSINARGLKFIPKLDLEFAPGLNIITGETGAGKTIFIKILLAAFGLYPLKEVFTHSGGHIEVIILDNGFEEGYRVIRREVSSEGRIKTYLDGITATQEAVKQLTTDRLIVHSQNQTVNLLKKSYQLRFFDSQDPEILSLVNQYQKARSEALRLKEELDQSLVKEFEYRQKMTILKEMIDQLEQLNPLYGEEFELKQKRDLIKHHVQIYEALSDALNALGSDEFGAVKKVGEAIEALRRIEDKLVGIKTLTEVLEQIQDNLNEVNLNLSGYLGDLEAGGMDLDTIEERLYRFQLIRKKFDLEPEADLARILEEKKKEYLELEMLVSSSAEREQNLRNEYHKLEKLAGNISEKRIALKERFEEEINKILKELNLGEGRFRVFLKPKTVKEDPYYLLNEPFGLDDLEFKFAIKQNEFYPVAKVASGGELSRLMLALETFEKEGSNKIYIFDEIDTGIGGKTAVRLGEYLSKLARSNQVIVITHLAQIAAFADAHFYIEKTEADSGFIVNIKPLVSREERIEEIARMLSGDLAGKNAVDHAEQLLEEVKARKV
jgi:DNA repair protein RecN (Recombination protein N)